MFVLIRQRIGILLMILFMPVNSPVWKMGIEGLGFDPGTFRFRILCIIIGFFYCRSLYDIHTKN